MSKRIVYLPVNLNLAEILTENPPSFKYKLDDFKYLISLIYEKHPSNDPLNIMEEGVDDFVFYDWIFLHSAFLQQKIRDYNKLLDYLEKQEIIESDHQFIPKEKAKGYRFMPKYRTFAKREFIDKFVNPKQPKIDPQDQKYFPKKLNYLNKWFQEKLMIDYKAASDEIELVKSTLNDTKIKIVQKTTSYMINLDRINEKEFFITHDLTGWRLHTNLTNFAKIFRKYITYDGVRMVSVDFSNSNMFFFNRLLFPDFWDDSINPDNNRIRLSHLNRKDLILEKVNHHLKLKQDKKYINQPDVLFEDSHIKLIKNLLKKIAKKSDPVESIRVNSYSHSFQKAIADDPKEIDRLVLLPELPFPQVFAQFYMESLIGSIYNKLKMEFLLEFDDSHELFNEFKVSVLAFFNASNRSIYYRPIRKIFVKRFPEVFHLLKLIKRNNHKRIAHLLQRMESTVVLYHCVKDFVSINGNVPIYTIHDCIVVPENYVDFLEKTIDSTCTRLLGFSPHLKREPWDEQK